MPLVVLSPLVPPQIVDPPAPVEALVGNTVEMRCAIEGEPLPEVSWSKNDETVILNDRVALMQNGSLMIHNTLVSFAVKVFIFKTSHQIL